MYGHNTAYRRILRQFKERQYEEDVLVIEFNDQFKKADGITTSRKVAHMKGWIMFYGNQGIAVFHSIPCLTCGRENDNIGQQYGQHFFCVTIDRDNLPKLLEQLWTAHPDIGYMNIPEEFINVGRMTDIWNGRFRKNFDQVLKSELQTLGGFEFVIHTRAHSAKQEHQDCPSLWDKIAELYHQSFKVQSWWNNTLLCDKCVRNGFCYTKRGIINILQTIIIGTAADSWEHTRDHTKIGISEGSNILCFGDLNHTVTQLRRGGSIYVFCNPNLVKIFKNTFRYEVEEKSFELNIVFIILSIIVFFLVLIYNYKF
uniref:Uncharacterized protein n=1 Tax=Panagrolaimus davidi TaxID=227884 RepID=A0A914PDC9_9BILA